MPNLIVFDFDGVLADTLSMMLSISEQVCANMGYPRKPCAEDLETLERMDLREFGRQLGLPETRIRDFVDDVCDGFAILESLPIFPGMGEAVKLLTKDHRLAIVTGNTRRAVDQFLKTHGLETCIELVLTDEDSGDRSEKLKRILSMIGEGTDGRFLVGDAVSDVRAAKENGLISVGVAWGHQSEARLLKAGVDRMAHTPEELLELVGS